MVKKISQSKAKKQIHEFFSDINDITQKDVKKIKRLAMKNNIHLKELRKKFCKKCFTPYKNPKIRIKNKTKTTICENCGYVMKYKIK